MILLLDTTVLIDALRSRQRRFERLQELSAKGHLLATSAINVAEVYAGMRPEERSRTEFLLGDLVLYPISFQIAQRAGTLKYEHARNGKTFDLPDLMVAATALEHDLILFTDNRKDFPFFELNFFEEQDWPWL